MTDLGDPKSVLRHYLRSAREDLIWKLDGVSERDARLPRTRTGDNLLGILKHCLNAEAGYFGPKDATLQRIAVHVLDDLARHAGHADVPRELHDGSVGLRRDRSNVPDGHDWPAYVARLTDLAHRFPGA